VGLSRDLMIRVLANQIQERAHGGPSRSLKRHLRTLAGEFEKGSLSLDPGVVLKTGARLVRQWRGHVHTVLVLEDGFEYEGQRYRSLTMIAARITGAHWSGPRFFGIFREENALEKGFPSRAAWRPPVGNRLQGLPSEALGEAAQ
jgi:hypothetical protein